MIRLFFSLFLGVSLIACEGSVEHVNMGNLTDYEVGRVILYKPADVQSIRITKVLGQDGSKYFVSESVNAYEFYDYESGKMVVSYRIPSEGPDAMKGGDEWFGGNLAK